jgi:1,2-diacylglycerol 3-alpha-glucosyltransferase
MKVLHCCLAAFYIDNYGYQENILPKMHKIQGHEVHILASTETYIKNKYLGYVEASTYISETGIPVTRIPYVKWLPRKVSRKLRIYTGITTYLNRINPDIIFIHDLQFISIKEICNYIGENSNVKVFVDGHTDYINSARNWLSKRVLHGQIYKWCAKKIEPYTSKFYGVLPLRVDFFHEVYKIPKNKIELLELGADDSCYDFSKKDIIRSEVRSTLGLTEIDFLIVTGGKIDERKKIHILIDVVNQISNKNIKLLVFGQPNTEMEKEILNSCNSKYIKYLGWLNPEDIYNFLFASDLGFFPGTHSVLWEQAIGVGLPCVFRKWYKIQHVDLGGNCIFIKDSKFSTIKETLLSIFNNPILLRDMKEIALTKGVARFSYSEIAKRAIIG